MQQHKTESEFLKELEGRASEEKKLLKTRIMRLARCESMESTRACVGNGLWFMEDD
ncbi:MAG: hypothetical protein UX64_C0047G0008 [Microgenomates group bacterium GW2011_GWC2_46_7]|nr:MAG: hypothetical protein UX64_C0047G0008 [Microgenomates group bacterium GW2011_GWC2_46_7]